MKPQAVSNMVWALGTLRHRPSDDALASIFHAVGPRLASFRAQELTNVVLGAAHMEYAPGDAFNASVFDAVRTSNHRSFEGQETSNLLWALARIGARAPDELVSTLLEQSAAQNLGGMASALNLSQCLWACAKMGVRAAGDVRQSGGRRVAAMRGAVDDGERGLHPLGARDDGRAARRGRDGRADELGGEAGGSHGRGDAGQDALGAREASSQAGAG